MSDNASHEQLRAARLALGVDLPTIARRTGVREPLLIAMETGRWRDLPHGLYARAAVRNYAAFLNLDADAILRSCEHELPAAEDPIVALARVRGLKPQYQPAPALPPAPRDQPVPALTEFDVAALRRAAASAAIDSLVIAIPLAVAVGITAALYGLPPSALRHTAPAFAVFGVLMAALYFLCFGGIGHGTPGGWLFGGTAAPSPLPHTWHEVRAGALAAALGDARAITNLGTEVYRRVARRLHTDSSVDGERIAI